MKVYRVLIGMAFLCVYSGISAMKPEATPITINDDMDVWTPASAARFLSQRYYLNKSEKVLLKDYFVNLQHEYNKRDSEREHLVDPSSPCSWDIVCKILHKKDSQRMSVLANKIFDLLSNKSSTRRKLYTCLMVTTVFGSLGLTFISTIVGFAVCAVA